MGFWGKISIIFGIKTPKTPECQKIPLKKSKEGKCEYVDPKSVRTLRLKTALTNFFNNIAGAPLSHDPIRRYVHVARRLPKDIQQRYGKAQDLDESHRLRLEDVESFRKEVNRGVKIDDVGGLSCILKNRKIIMDLNHILYEMRDLEQGIRWIKKAIHNLGEQHPRQVIKLKDGSKTFCIPGGNRKNPVCYEFKLTKEGDLFFIVHNRCADQKGNKMLLGNAITEFKCKNKEYCKTSVCIKVNKKKDGSFKVADDLFLISLIQAERAGNTEDAYRIIHEHLLKGDNPGTIFVSQHEEAYLKKITNPDITPEEIEQLQQNILEHDHCFNNLEQFDSSAVSNFTSPEKVMATRSTRKQLRYHTLCRIVEQIQKETFLHQKAMDAAWILHIHSEKNNHINPEGESGAKSQESE